MAKSSSLALLLLLGACDSSEESWTWGEVAEEVSTIYCDAQITCGASEEFRSPCISHATWHLCEPEQTCDAAVSVDPEPALAACREAALNLDEGGCYFLGAFGLMPEECTAAFDLEPDDSE